MARCTQHTRAHTHMHTHTLSIYHFSINERSTTFLTTSLPRIETKNCTSFPLKAQTAEDILRQLRGIKFHSAASLSLINLTHAQLSQNYIIC